MRSSRFAIVDWLVDDVVYAVVPLPIGNLLSFFPAPIRTQHNVWMRPDGEDELMETNGLGHWGGLTGDGDGQQKMINYKWVIFDFHRRFDANGHYFLCFFASIVWFLLNVIKGILRLVIDSMRTVSQSHVFRRCWSYEKVVGKCHARSGRAGRPGAGNGNGNGAGAEAHAKLLPTHFCFRCLSQHPVWCATERVDDNEIMSSSYMDIRISGFQLFFFSPWRSFINVTDGMASPLPCWFHMQMFAKDKPRNRKHMKISNIVIWDIFGPHL